MNDTFVKIKCHNSLSMVNSRATDLKKKVSLKEKQKSSQIMPPRTKNKRLTAIQIENTSVDLNTLNYIVESVNTSLRKIP